MHTLPAMGLEALKTKNVLLCVGGSIAAYKAGEVARLLVKAGARVRVAMTASAQRFVAPLTFQALTGERVSTDLFDAAQELAAGHISLADWADLVVVAPATAELLGSARLGLAHDVVLATLLAARAPVLMAPAMNERMWANAATQENVGVLRARGVRFVGPDAGEMAEAGHAGVGRMAEPEAIALAAASCLGARDLAGVRVVVTAGPTREHLDPVRFLSNPSTGRMGFALAEAARDRGADVTLVTGPVELASPPGVRVVRITTADELLAAVRVACAGARALVMAAAVADQRPETRAAHKVKKPAGPEDVRLVRTPDVLQTLAAEWGAAKPVVVGFAAETENVVANARAKLAAKGLDLVVANDVSAPGAGFAADTNAATLVDAAGEEPIALTSKRALAERIWDRVAALL